MDHLLSLAKEFHDTPPTDTRRQPDRYASVAEAVRLLSGGCRFEAHRALAEPMETAPPSKPHFVRAAVDLDGDSPGLWTRDGIYKGDHRKPRREAGSKRRTRDGEDDAAGPPDLRGKRSARREEGAQREAGSGGGETTRRKEERETPSPRGGGRSERRRPREGGGARDAVPREEEEERETPSPEEEEEPPLLLRWLHQWRRRRPRPPSPRATPRALCDQRHSLFPSPLPMARAYDALQRCEVHPVLRTALLEGRRDPEAILEATDGVRIVHGAPGTGKSYTVLEELASLAELPATGPQSLRRVLVTAATNEAVNRLAEAALARLEGGAKVGGKNKKPPRVLWTTPEGRRRGHGDTPTTGTGRMVAFATVGSRNGGRLARVDFDAVLVDEAALVPEYELWGLLRKTTRRLVLVGDHRQLRATVSHEGKALLHGRSTMERLVEAGYPCDFLTRQYRLPPELGDFVSRHFYEGRLETPHAGLRGEGVLRVVAVKGEEEARGTSRLNAAEAQRAVAVASQLRRQGAGEVALLCPYAAQRDLVAAMVAEGDFADSLRVLTVDSSQGREYDHVVLTTVRVGRRCGFWDDPSRLLVALSRARGSVTVVGHPGGWRWWGEAWSELAERADR